MKWIKHSLIILALISLSACQKEMKTDETNKETTTSQQSVKPKKSQENEKSVTTTQTPKIKESKDSKESSDKATYKGDYYSVQGKYDEIIIVNKQHPLSSTYNPGEDPTAKAALLQIIADMQALGYDVSNNYSGFRSYETQDSLYHSYVERDSKENADRYSARPGYSEHQTGLAYDLIDNSGQLLEEPNASAWLKEHAPEYGFIVRYLQGKEHITGYQAESWHLRYIGKEAQDIADSGLTLEEYFGIAGGDYPD
ncbi:LD-carboxypeptidase LdcB/DacB [Streptococcus sp. CSL10205-OR2]|uniref:LD-carboxypeptidase LdcB/DacB n=1 Tax=Streptococcus sp. CSL10205-OR2 TaxID=2980558 RepID=UPI0021D909EE|nr:LD-carboxypeptidase LdcB/DacB [Streptococcus sp. CSL10205-OR2]MCU9533687.1 M15 family metallopeptidase [Streptococcus sp. CSL10205-OR2]